ncbi:MAG: FtsX-like permease family protein [Bacteroidota bacterium]
MQTPLRIARRYLFSRKSNNAINIITLVCILGIAIVTAALILVLSVFNGLTAFIEDQFAAIDPDVKIIAAEGKFFEEDDQLFANLLTLPYVDAVTRTVEDRVWLEFFDNQALGVIKGVESDFNDVNPIDSFIYRGGLRYTPKYGISQGVFGSEIAAKLSVDMDNSSDHVSIYHVPPDAKLKSVMDAASAINVERMFPSGYFSVQKAYDEKYVFTQLKFAQKFFGAEGKLSAYEIKTSSTNKVDAVKEQIESIISDEYEVLTWYEQHKTLYRVMRNEKFISYLILVLMLALVSVNIVGSLSMIVIEKRKDVSVLRAMGSSSVMVRQVFFILGLLIGGIGGGIGVIIAALAGFAQQYFELVQIAGGDTFSVKAFPIELALLDFLLVFLTVIVLSAVASLYPARQAASVEIVEGLKG